MATHKMQINGEARDIASRSVAELLAELSLDPRQVAIERNGEIIPRSRYAEQPIAEGDRIEVVAFIGGG
jgi:thiamine biosynthesis protein ThiS